jgi:hypothetical protein
MSSAPVLDRHEPAEIEAPAGSSPGPAGFARRAGAYLVREFLEILPPMIFFFIGFNPIVLTANLILADYGAQFASFMTATASALIVAKALLVANAMPAITSRPSNLPPNKRQRILELVKLSKLADAHSLDEFHDPANPANAGLVGIVSRLPREPQPHAAVK